MPNCCVCNKPVSAGLVIDKSCHEEMKELIKGKTEETLFIVPCKVASDIWYLKTEYLETGPETKAYKGYVESYTLGIHGDIVATIYNEDLGIWEDKEIECFGEEVFLSEAEAQAYLERKCRVCGCTFDNGCRNSCYWVESDLCSQCENFL